jgi:hypothetical protein
MKGLPEYLQQKPSLRSVAQIAYNRREQRVALKGNAERRVQLCEEHLQALRQELSEAERELQEVESNVHAWRQFFSHSEVGTTADVSSTASGFTGFPDDFASDAFRPWPMTPFLGANGPRLDC